MLTQSKFEKVSYEQFEKDFEKNINSINEYSKENIEDIYNNIQIPSVSSRGSAGEDFYAPYDIILKSNQFCIIPTGIRCKMSYDLVMQIYPRSSYGIKHNMSLLNTVAIIDSDYYYADNEGHIMIAIKNNGKKMLKIKKGDRFCQAIFTQFFHSLNVDIGGDRHGGIGSSGE